MHNCYPFAQATSDLNYKLTNLLEQLESVAKPGSAVELEQPIPLFNLMPKVKQDFYR